jgi:hypothetical protein
MRLDGIEVKDARRALMLNITKADCNAAKRKAPDSCAAAH